MAVTANLYTNAAEAAFKGLINDIAAGANATKVALVASAYTPDQNAHTSWGDVSANEVSGTGYTAGGQALTTKTLTSATGVTTFDADDVTWINSTITARYAVVYDDVPAADADKMLLCYVDFGQDEESVDGDFEIQWNASGIFAYDVS